MYIRTINTFFPSVFFFTKVIKDQLSAKEILIFLSPIIKNPYLQIKKKYQGDIATDNFICLLHVYPTIYVNFILISSVFFEKKKLIDNRKDTFFGYSD